MTEETKKQDLQNNQPARAYNKFSAGPVWLLLSGVDKLAVIRD